MAQENTDMDSGFVIVNFLKDFTIWDYDHGLYDRIIYFDKNCWPVKIIAAHLCCPPSIFAKIIKPVAYPLLDKHRRSRILIHDVLESQVPDVLSSYGICEDMLPTEIGGTVQLDHAEWIANRRAAELKEI
jgi:CRAL/TRIO domain